MLKKEKLKETFIPMGAAVPQVIFQNLIASEWLTSAQVAQYLGISENALRIMVHRRQIKFHKIGRRLRYHREDVLSLLPAKGRNDDQSIYG